MSKKRRSNFTAVEKVAILREHLLENVPISDLCDKHNIQPSQFYGWQKKLFENGEAALESHPQQRERELEKKVTKLENVTREKDGSEEHSGLFEEVFGPALDVARGGANVLAKHGQELALHIVHGRGHRIGRDRPPVDAVDAAVHDECQPEHSLVEGTADEQLARVEKVAACPLWRGGRRASRP